MQKAMNMGAELRAEKFRNASDQHIVSVTSLDGLTLTTNEGTCKIRQVCCVC